MIEMLVYILMAAGNSSNSTAAVIGHFKSIEQCEHVRKNIPGYVIAKCIQTNILLPK